MGIKLLWTGLTLIEVSRLIGLDGVVVPMVGAVLMIFGIILYLFDK